MLFQSIYVLPTEENIPPRAIIGQIVPTQGGAAITGVQATWSHDVGTWVNEESIPFPQELADMITEHAKALGVEQFQ